MPQCKIALDNYTGQYYAGGEIVGKVECYFDHDIKIRAVKIRVKCMEHNEWNDSEEYLDPHDNKYKTRWVVYTGDKDVIFTEKILFNSDGHRLDRGRHVYPFTITLPKEVPSTFNGSYGGIRWEMTAIVDIPMAIDYEDRFTFIVMSPIDLNKLDDDYFHDTNYSDEKTVCCWCCQGGTVTMDVDMPKTAFVAGEEIPLKITICNLSRESIDSLQVSLEKELTFIVKDPSRKEKYEYENIATVNEHGVGAHGEHTFNIKLSVPSYQEIPNFALCTLFQSEYYIKITAETPACSTDLEMTIYPKFGHIQRGHSNEYDPQQTSQMNTNYPTNNDSYPPVSPQYPPAPGINYPPPVGGPYPPPVGGPYPPPAGGPYPPPAGGPYPPPAGGPYPPSPAGGPYPPSPAGGPYPPPLAGAPYSPSGPSYPPPSSPYPPQGTPYSPTGTSYPPSSTPSYPPASGPGYPTAGGFVAPGSSDKPIYPSGSPSAPPNYPPNSKAAEAIQNTDPSAPPSSNELPPPSYNEIQKNHPPYPPQ